jgi:hypothetical protein
MKKGSSAGRPTVHRGYTFFRIVETENEISVIIYYDFYKYKALCKLLTL